MTFLAADLVSETSTTTGAGPYTLGGPVGVPYRSMATAGIAHGDTCLCQINDSVNGGFETGLYTWGTGGILTRTTIEASSNAGAAVSWPAGTRTISMGLSAGNFKSLRNGNLPLLDLGTVSGAVNLDLSVAHAFKAVLTGTTTFTISGASNAPLLEQFVLDVRTAGNAITWPASVRFTNDIPPALSNTGRAILRFQSDQGATLWAAQVAVSSFDLIAPSYLDYRLNITRCGTSGYTAFTEWEIRASAGGGDLVTPGNAISASSSYPGYPASSAIDRNFDTSWLTLSTANPITLRVTLASASRALEVALTTRSDGNEGPISFSVDGSGNGGASWTTIKSFTNVVWTGSTTQLFSLA